MNKDEANERARRLKKLAEKYSHVNGSSTVNAVRSEAQGRQQEDRLSPREALIAMVIGYLLVAIVVAGMMFCVAYILEWPDPWKWALASVPALVLTRIAVAGRGPA